MRTDRRRRSEPFGPDEDLILLVRYYPASLGPGAAWELRSEARIAARSDSDPVEAVRMHFAHHHLRGMGRVRVSHIEVVDRRTERTLSTMAVDLVV